jgi:hypothetical protein
MVNKATILKYVKKQLPEAVARLLDEGHKLRMAGDFHRAQQAFERAAVEAEKTPAHDRGHKEAIAWANLCGGHLAMLSTDGPVSAQGWFNQAYDGFKALGDGTNILRAEAMWFQCEASKKAEAKDFDGAIGELNKAVVRFQALEIRVPGESLTFKIIGCEVLAQAAVYDMFDDILGEDFDGARTGLSEARRHFRDLALLAPLSPWRPFYDANLQFAEALIPYLRGMLDVKAYRISAGKRLLDKALQMLDSAGAALKSDQPRPPKWHGMEAVLQGLAMQCKAAQMEADSMESCLGGTVVGAPARFREVAEAYDAALERFADGGMGGYSGLYTSAGDRDRLNAMADAVERIHGTEFSELPQFNRFVSSPELARMLVRDYREMIAGFFAGAWKTTLVTAGSIMETLLLDGLRAHWADVVKNCKLTNNASPKRAAKWKLEIMIERAEKAGLIGKGNRYVSDALRDHRNLIHPAKEERGNYKIDKASALSSVRAVNELIRNWRAKRAKATVPPPLSPAP